jgi:alpha-1,3-rhamnosyl/mannosyltransferase
MRIGIEIAVLEAPHWTGVERYLLQLLRAFAGMETDHRFFLFSRNPVPLPFPLPGNVRPAFDESRLPLALWRELRLPRLAGDKAIEVYHSPVAAFPLRGGFRKVVTVHELTWLGLARPTERLRLFHHRLRFRIASLKADGIIVGSRSAERDILASAPAAGRKIRVISHGIDASFHPLPEPDPAGQWPLKAHGIPREPFLLAVGTIYAKKNVDLLLRAHRILLKDQGKKLNLVLVGKRGRGSGKWARIVRSGPPGGRIFLPGYVPQEDLVAFYNRAEVLLYPSLYEGFGFPPLESMACGTPVIASRRGAIPEVIGDAALLLDELTPEGLADAVCRLLDDHHLREGLIRKGLRRSTSFRWRRSAERTLAFYREVGLRGKTPKRA